MYGSRLLVLALAAVLVAVAGPARSSSSPRAARGRAVLSPPPGAPASARLPSGTVRMKRRRVATTFRFRLRRLAPREALTIRRRADGAVIARATADRRGRVRLKVTFGSGPAGAGRFTGRELEVVRDGTGRCVLRGIMPGSVVEDGGGGGTGGGGDAGGGSGGGDDPETRLAGVGGTGPFPVASAVFSLPTAPGGLAPGRTVVYYPGTGTALSPARSRYSPIILVHGFQLRAADYSAYGRMLASWGFVVLVGDHTDPPLYADHEKEIATTLGYLRWLVARNGDASSRFSGRLDVSNMGVMGHSLGGGASLVAATRSGAGGRVKAWVGLAPAPLLDAAGRAILPDAGGGRRPPSLVITGSEDLVIAPAASRSRYYTPAPSPKTFLRIDGHCHAHYADSLSFPASLATDYNPATCVSREVQTRKTRTYLVSWFLYHLYGDTRVTDYVDGTYAAEDPSVEEYAAAP